MHIYLIKKNSLHLIHFNSFNFSLETLNLIILNSGTSGARISEVVLGASSAFS